MGQVNKVVTKMHLNSKNTWIKTLQNMMLIKFMHTENYYDLPWSIKYFDQIYFTDLTFHKSHCIVVKIQQPFVAWVLFFVGFWDIA